MGTGKAVALIGTLDTKGPEIDYIRDLFNREQQPCIVIDSGILGEPRAKADITREEVALAAGHTLEQVQNSGSRGNAVEIMADGLAVIVKQLYASRRIAGVMGIGGAEGGLMAAHAAQQLPLGAPKLVVSPSASGRREFGPYIGTSDMLIMHSVIDILGLNFVSKTVFETAVSAMVGMVRFSREVPAGESPRVGITMLGQTTPGATVMVDALQKAGYETIIYHANGIGGPAMDKLISEGRLEGVIEFTISELANSVRGGQHETDDSRATAAVRAELPLVLVPGAGDFFNQGAIETLDPSLKTRQHYRHNPVATLVRLNEAESRRLGQIICERLAGAKRPVKIVLPLRGLSLIGVSGEAIHNPAADAALFESIREHAPQDVEIIELDEDINSATFARRVAEEFIALHRLSA